MDTGKGRMKSIKEQLNSNQIEDTRRLVSTIKFYFVVVNVDNFI